MSSPYELMGGSGVVSGDLRGGGTREAEAGSQREGVGREWWERERRGEREREREGEGEES